MSQFTDHTQHGIDQHYNLDQIAVRRKQDISRLRYQRDCVLREAGSSVRSNTVEVYDRMIAMRQELLADIESRMQKRRVA